MSILIGVNDMWRRYDQNDPTSVQDFERDYRDILARTPARVVIAEPFLLPVSTEQLTYREDLDPKLEVVRDLATKFDAALVPLDAELTKVAAEYGPENLAHDGVHPTSRGHELIAEIWRTTRGVL